MNQQEAAAVIAKINDAIRLHRESIAQLILLRDRLRKDFGL